MSSEQKYKHEIEKLTKNVTYMTSERNFHQALHESAEYKVASLECKVLDLEKQIRMHNTTIFNYDQHVQANAGKMLQLSDRISELAITQPASGATDREKKLEVAMCCPISSDLFKEPVLCTVTGHSFEKESIQRWLRTSDLCPLTRKKMTSADLVPNITLVGVVEAFKIQQLP